jgi:hypothetical protein
VAFDDRSGPPDARARETAATRKAEAFEQLDAAMARADEVLRRYAAKPHG